MKTDSYVQCTLTRETVGGERVEMVEWVSKHLAEVGNYVTCKGWHWVIEHVGHESSDPRSAHECKT